MKNYIITSNEYEIVKRRLDRLYDRREKLKNNILNITSKLQDVVVSSNNNNDKMGTYVAELELVENEIAIKEQEANDLKSDLDYMDSRISNIQDIKEQVFVMFYIKGMKPKHIAPRIPCDLSTVYAKIREIKAERQSSQKIQKIL